MKKHAIIPIFISHRGCPHNCIFCNQKKITARDGDVTPEDARKIIDEWLTTLSEVETVEVSFFGGSFTAIPMEDQTAFLKVAKEYKDKGLIDKIHMSTRPDFIDEEILDNLKKYGADVIELGVQSFDEEVLKLSERGHSANCVYEASKLIKDYEFTLGIQLMVGLPGDSLEKCIYSANETVKIAPEIARIYPTIAIKGTKLYELYENGLYTPLSEDEAVIRSKAIYEILDDNGINIIRVGLKSSEIMDNELSFHPAFRQLVEGEIARERIEKSIAAFYASKAKVNGDYSQDQFSKGSLSENRFPCELIIKANQHSFNNISGHNQRNKKYFEEKYPEIKMSFEADNSLKDNEYLVIQI